MTEGICGGVWRASHGKSQRPCPHGYKFGILFERKSAICDREGYNYPMIELNIPGYGTVKLEHLVCDVNGTLAIDGKLIDGVARKLALLQDRLILHLLTADTHGRQNIIDQQLNLEAIRVTRGREAEQKATYVKNLTADQVIAIGQGANDALMLKTAQIGIAIFSKEGLASESLSAADIVVPDIHTALELIEKPLRLVATLRR
jgi:soluble P-type ATPase